MKRTLALAALLALAAPVLASAKPLEFAVDPNHSQVGFKARHLLSRVPGDFEDFSGTVWLDPANVAGTLKLQATIQTASIDTRNDKRNGHLRSADFFDAEKFPTITFESKSVKAIDKETFEVAGDLTMRGVTKPVTLTAKWFGVLTPEQPAMTALDLTGTVNRKDWGINWSHTLDNGGVVVADEVEIEVHIEANVPKGE